jgi:hypothetical protein
MRENFKSVTWKRMKDESRRMNKEERQRGGRLKFIETSAVISLKGWA